MNTLGDAETRTEFGQLLQRYLQKHQAQLSPDSQARFERGSFLRILDSKADEDQAIIESAPQVIDCLKGEALQIWQELTAALDHLDVPYTVDHKLVRGLDYYSGPIFEFLVPGTKSALLAGGRYDGLAEVLGGKPTKVGTENWKKNN